MRILVLTNIYPTQSNPWGGTFVTSRILAHRSLDAEVQAVAVHPVPGVVVSRAGRAVSHPLARDPYESVHLDLTARMTVRHLWRPPASSSLDLLAARTLELVKVRPDVIHAHGMYAVPAGMVAHALSKRLGAPFVVTMHGSDVTRPLGRRRHALRTTLDAAGAQLFVSQALAEQAQDRLGPSPRVRVIANGVDLDIFTLAAGARADPPTMLYVGNLERVKGADRLPEIFASLRLSVPGARLVIVGDGRVGPHLRTVLTGPDVEHAGRLPPTLVAERMRQASVLIVPSRREGLGTVIPESYACGTPVVATGVGGIPEAIVSSAHLVPEGPELAGRFAATVARVLARGPTPAELRAHVADSSWRSVAQAERRVYADVLHDG